MTDRTRATYSRRAASKNSEIKKDEQPVVEKEDSAESKLEIERFRNDPSQLQSLTAKELRDFTRRIEVSVKGNKKDLLSALMETLAGEENGKEENSPVGKVNPSEAPSNQKVGASIVVEEKKTESSEVISEAPRKKRSRTTQKSVKSTNVEENSVTNVKLSKTLVQKETLIEPWTVLVHKKPQPGWIPYNPKSLRPQPLSKDTKAMKILSWNVNGLKALLKSRGFSVQELTKREGFDVLCLPETKCRRRMLKI
jgi:exodeoxyribonuclease III